MARTLRVAGSPTRPLEERPAGPPRNWPAACHAEPVQMRIRPSQHGAADPLYGRQGRAPGATAADPPPTAAPVAVGRGWAGGGTVGTWPQTAMIGGSVSKRL